MNNQDLKDVAKKYLNSGWSVLPAKKSEYSDWPSVLATDWCGRFEHK